MSKVPERRHTIYGLICATAQMTVMAWWATALPSQAAVPLSYRNDYRVCAGRLTSVGISIEAAASSCTAVLDPRVLSKCVIDIKNQTSIIAADALATCVQVRRPNELAECVVAISQTRDTVAPAVLDYCRSSLLPSRFAECVVGLRREIDLTSLSAMNSCIDASDQRPRDFYPNFVPQNGTPPIQVLPTPTTTSPAVSPETPPPTNPGQYQLQPQ